MTDSSKHPQGPADRGRDVLLKRGFPAAWVTKIDDARVDRVIAELGRREREKARRRAAEEE